MTDRNGPVPRSSDRSEGGYILLVSVLVASAALLVISTAVAVGVSRGASRTILVQHANAAKRLAEGCMETALLRLQQNQAYAGNETVTIGGNPCLIRPNGISPLRLRAEAVVAGAIYRLEAQIDNVESVTIGTMKRVGAFQ